MTAVECINAVKFAVWNVFRIKGLTVWQRLQLALLKVVAVCGYHHGKYLSFSETTRNSPAIASHRDALRAVRAVNGSVSLRALTAPTKARWSPCENAADVRFVVQGGQNATGN